ncbi:hypothetical protein ACSNOI_01980 [Actinomadura kijaniata]|uniref:hypothetical protein n=1 Tax=Actinomadura kijaniata TaxID=46161 RepID=UPI003F1A86B0
MENRDGRMHVPARFGLGITLTGQGRAWAVDAFGIGARPWRAIASGGDAAGRGR